MFSKSITRSVILALIALCGACADYTSPRPIEDRSVGTFALVSADEHTLPAVVFDGIVVADPDPSFHLRVIATSGSFTIDGTGRYAHHVEHDTFVDGVLNGRVIHSDHGDCTRAGAALHCVSNFLENVEFSGTVSGGAIAIAQDLTGEGHTAVYRYEWRGATTP